MRSRDEVPKKNEELAHIIDSDRYYLVRALEKRGCWGGLYLAWDVKEEKERVIKVHDPNEIAQKQQEERGLDEKAVLIQKEGAITLQSMAHVVQRWVETDKNGREFLVMNHYESGDYADIYRDGSNYRLYLGHGLKRESVMNFLAGVSSGLGELHSRSLVHGDLKLDNIVCERFVDRSDRILEKALITDLGTATCVASRDLNSERKNLGALQVRAPEVCRDEGRPTYASDVFAFGSLVSRLTTGCYLLEDKINELESSGLSQEEIQETIGSLSEKDYTEIVKRQLRRVPKPYRGLVQKCVVYSPYQRLADGRSVSEALDEVHQGILRKKINSQNIVRGLFISGLIGVFGLIGLCSETYEPQEISFPTVHNRGSSSGLVVENLDFIHGFQTEDLILPAVEDNELRLGDGLFKNACRDTGNVYAVYLLKNYFQALHDVDALKLQRLSEAQQNIATLYSVEGMSVSRSGDYSLDQIARSIEVTLMKAIELDGYLDLEDTLVISRLGYEKWVEARTYAGQMLKAGSIETESGKNNVDYSVYSQAKDSRGMFVIPLQEQIFLAYWMSHVASDMEGHNYTFDPDKYNLD